MLALILSAVSQPGDDMSLGDYFYLMLTVL
jgi:hypothetical protein